ncbi:MAG: major capsid protein [Thermodesulfovibrionales bacterium]|nr:major capsid protein [Thermodesulfovibrionales bacterium]
MFPNLVNDPAFNVASLSAAINILPNNYGRVIKSGLFPIKGIITRAVVVEEYAGVLTILPTKPLGSPGTTGKTGKRKVRTFNVPHIPHDDVLLAADIAGKRAFGSQTELESMNTVLLDRLQAMKNKHMITLEHLSMGALKGIILDADASILYNLYTEFEISQKEVDFLLGTAGTEVANKCREVVRHIEANLQGEVMSSIRALVSQEFYDKLIVHVKVEKAYANYAAAQDRIGGDLRKGFTFGGLTFEEYVGSAPDGAGNTRRFIAASEGHAYPEGTNDTFATHCAPADFVEAVNTIGQHLYAKAALMKFDRGYELHTQSNPLPLCHRPAVLVKVKTST